MEYVQSSTSGRTSGWKYACPFRHTSLVEGVEYNTPPCGTAYRCGVQTSNYKEHLATRHPTVTLLTNDQYGLLAGAADGAMHDKTIERLARYQRTNNEFHVGIQVRTNGWLSNDYSRYPEGMIMFVVNAAHTVFHICYAEVCEKVSSFNRCSKLYRIALSTDEHQTPYKTQAALERRVVEVLAAYMKLAPAEYARAWFSAATEIGFHSEQIYKQMMTADDRSEVRTATTADSATDTITAGCAGNQLKVISKRGKKHTVHIARSAWDHREKKKFKVMYTMNDEDTSTLR